MSKPLLVKKTFEINDTLYIRRRVLQAASRLHWHDFYEIEIIVSGAGSCEINGNKYELKSGRCFFLTPQDVHFVDYHENTEIITIHFSDSSADAGYINRVMHSGNKMTQADENDYKRIVSICELIKEANEKAIKNREYISHLLECVLLILAEYNVSQSLPKTHPPHVQKAILYIKSHFNENPSLEEVSDMLFLNKHYFTTLFKSHMGIGYKDYLRCVKLEYAAGLVRTTDLAITSIAAQSGYGSISNFNREFKAFFKLSPTQMRKNSYKQEKTAE